MSGRSQKLITKQTICFFLEVDPLASFEDILAEAKNLAVCTKEMVVFTMYHVGVTVKVGPKSDLSALTEKYYDRNNNYAVIE